MWLGFVFFVALVVLGFTTLLLKNLNPFGHPMVLRIHFERAQGLRPGSDVRVDGVLFGRVDQVMLHPVSGVRVVVKVSENITLYKDAEILVESSSVLGGNIVSIKRGKPEAGKPPKEQELDLTQELAGKSRPGLEEVGELVDENRANVRALIANLKDVSQALKDGQGTIGKLLKSDELHKETVDTIKEVRAEIKKVGDSIDTNITALTKKVTDKLDNAQGPAGKILNDKAMADKLDRIVTNVEETSKNLKEITDSVKKGEGALGKMVNDKEMGEKLRTTIDNVERASESIKNIGTKLEIGEGSVGKLLQEDGLYEQAQKSLEDLDKFFGRASHALLEFVTDYNSFPDTKMTVTHLGIRIGPDPDKFIYAGAALLGLKQDGSILYHNQANGNTTTYKGELQLGYRAPWMLDRHLTVRAGLMEGKPGGGAEFLWEDWGLFAYPVRFCFEIRDAYNSVPNERIDEEIAGPLMRAYVKFPLWIRRDTWYETLLSRLQVVGGVDRLAKDSAFFVGISVDWPDEDLRTLVGLLGAAR
jgi:phospholipid/cholesterol/gamma-HCH transport system substrate-binding protein